MKNLSTLLIIGFFLKVSFGFGQYCTSTHSNVVPYSDFIVDVTFNSISNQSGSAPSGYGDYTAFSTELNQTISYNLSVSVVNLSASTQYVMAWIDWNQNGFFTDPGESYVIGSTTLSFETFNKAITIPATATLGTTRMRIITLRSNVPGPCNNSPNGETEDYSVVVDVPPVFWTGNVNSSWAEPGNWSSASVPDVNVPVIIPGGMPNYPIIGNGLFIRVNYGVNSCKSLTIKNGGNLTLTIWGDITIFGNVTVESGGELFTNVLKLGYGGRLWIFGGTVTANNQLRFEGGGGNMTSGNLYASGIIDFQSLSGWSANGGNFRIIGGSTSTIFMTSAVSYINHLIVESNATATLSGTSTNPFYINGDLVMQPGSNFTVEEVGNNTQLTVGGNLVLQADATGKGSFIDETGASVSVLSNTKAENYYTDNRWHFISSPVSGAVSNVFLGIYMKEFDEATNSYGPYITSTSVPLGAGKGFEIWSTLGNPTVTFIGGNLNSGDNSPMVFATDREPFDGLIGADEGFNLIGNPYPSAIDLGTENDPLGYTWDRLDLTVYAWNGASWSGYNIAGDGAEINGGTQYIPSMQGFFVHANDFYPALTIPNSARVHHPQANYKAGNSKSGEIRLLASGNGYTDEILVRSLEGATELFDSKYDGYKLPGLDEVPQLSSMIGSVNLIINSIPEITNETIIPLSFVVGVSGIYSIESNEFNLEDLNLTPYLEDIKEGSIISLEGNSIYEFAYHVDDVNHRFNLFFKDTENDEPIGTSDFTNIYSYDNVVYVQKEVGVSADVIIYDLMGREINRVDNNTNDKIEIPLSCKNGNYIVKVITGNRIETKKVYIQ